MVRISGYGQSGPYAERPGYGAICEAVGGVRHLTGDPDRPPARVALATTDYLSSVYAAFGAMAAIHSRHASGRGQVVDVALYEAAFSQLEPAVPAFEKLGVVPKREGPNLPSMAPNSLYPTRDGGWVLIAANSQPTWKRLVALMQQPQLLTDPRFETVQVRGKPEHMKALDALISDWTRGFDAPTLEVLVRAGEVPTSRVYTIADIYADPQFQARDMLLQVPHATLGHTTQSGVVPRLSATPGSVRHSGPDLGVDGVDILRRELGKSEQEIETLCSGGAVCLPQPV
jgi:formyl-CoA transferase